MQPLILCNHDYSSYASQIADDYFSVNILSVVTSDLQSGESDKILNILKIELLPNETCKISMLNIAAKFRMVLSSSLMKSPTELEKIITFKFL